jgi:flagellin
MLTGQALQLTTRRMGDFYNATQSALSFSLERLASGKRYNRPKDGIVEFMRADRISRDLRGYRTVRRDLGEGLSMMKTAESAGMNIVDSLKRMKELVNEYWENEEFPTEQEAIEREFEGLRDSIQAVVDSNYFHAVDLMQNGTVAGIRVDPNDYTRTIDLTFDAGDVVDPTAMDITDTDRDTAMATVDTQYDAAMSYLSKVTGYVHTIESQLAVTDSMIENGKAYESTLNEVDDVEELSTVVAKDIRQQAALSMIAQGNMYQMGVLQLVRF